MQHRIPIAERQVVLLQFTQYLSGKYEQQDDNFKYVRNVYLILFSTKDGIMSRISVKMQKNTL
jgi:hypothetical protein